MDSFMSNLFYYTHKSLKIVNMEDIMFRSTSPIDHIIDDIYLGDFRAADNLTQLKEHNITHIINCALGIPEQFSSDIIYLSLNMKDNLSQDLTNGIKSSMEFIISEREKNPNAKFFIHCKQGVSRSVAIVLSYMIIHNRMNYEDSVEYLLKRRNVAKPNSYFAEQLRKLEEDIKTENDEKIEK
jgi:protein-tyrosine phosphatase